MAKQKTKKPQPRLHRTLYGEPTQHVPVRLPVSIVEAIDKMVTSPDSAFRDRTDFIRNAIIQAALADRGAKRENPKAAGSGPTTAKVVLKEEQPHPASVPGDDVMRLLRREAQKRNLKPGDVVEINKQKFVVRRDHRVGNPFELSEAEKVAARDKAAVRESRRPHKK